MLVGAAKQAGYPIAGYKHSCILWKPIVSHLGSVIHNTKAPGSSPWHRSCACSQRGFVLHKQHGICSQLLGSDTEMALNTLGFVYWKISVFLWLLHSPEKLGGFGWLCVQSWYLWAAFGDRQGQCCVCPRGDACCCPPFVLCSYGAKQHQICLYKLNIRI